MIPEVHIERPKTVSCAMCVYEKAFIFYLVILHIVDEDNLPTLLLK